MRFYGGTCFISRRYYADIKLSCAERSAGTRDKMNVQNEMQNMFRRVAAGEVEPAEWEQWWNSHRDKLEEILNRGDRERIMPAAWNADHFWMTKTQSGIAYYFHSQGRPVKISDHYEKKAQEEDLWNRREAVKAFHERTAPVRKQWESYLEEHPTEPVVFDWKSLMGTPPLQKPPQIFTFQKVRDEIQWKQVREELQVRLKENMQAKIVRESVLTMFSLWNILYSGENNGQEIRCKGNAPDCLCRCWRYDRVLLSGILTGTCIRAWRDANGYSEAVKILYAE